MSKKFLCFSIIFFISILLFNVSYATNINIATELENTATDSVQTIDDTIYTSDTNVSTTESTDYSDYGPVATTTTTDYEDSTELSISNMINIVLIVVGVVLILLGIAIIIKLK